MPDLVRHTQASASERSAIQASATRSNAIYGVLGALNVQTTYRGFKRMTAWGSLCATLGNTMDVKRSVKPCGTYT